MHLNQLKIGDTVQFDQRDRNYIPEGKIIRICLPWFTIKHGEREYNVHADHVISKQSLFYKKIIKGK